MIRTAPRVTSGPSSLVLLRLPLSRHIYIKIWLCTEARNVLCIMLLLFSQLLQVGCRIAGCVGEDLAMTFRGDLKSLGFYHFETLEMKLTVDKDDQLLPIRGRQNLS